MARRLHRVKIAPKGMGLNDFVAMQEGFFAAEDLDVETVGAMPPTIEGRGGEHRQAAPGANEGSEGRTETPDFYRGFALRRAGCKRVGEDQVTAGDAR